MTEVERQASPFLAADVRDLLAMLNTALNVGARDAALLTLGWGAALRRSELVGLDWEQLGTGTGFVRTDQRGILITLARSKASQDQAETVVTPALTCPRSARRWRPGPSAPRFSPAPPIFTAVNNRNMIAAERLTAHLVSRIVKRAMRDLARRRGKSDAEAKDMVRRFLGTAQGGLRHLRRGCRLPALRIQKHCRHKSAEMTARYVREFDKWSKSGLKGILHRGPVEGVRP